MFVFFFQITKSQCLKSTQCVSRNSVRRKWRSAKRARCLSRRIKYFHRGKEKPDICRKQERKQEKETACPLCKGILSDENAVLDHLCQGQCPSDKQPGRDNCCGKEQSDRNAPIVSNKRKIERAILRPSRNYNKFSHRRESDSDDAVTRKLSMRRSMDSIVTSRKPVCMETFLTN